MSVAKDFVTDGNLVIGLDVVDDDFTDDLGEGIGEPVYVSVPEPYRDLFPVGRMVTITVREKPA